MFCFKLFFVDFILHYIIDHPSVNLNIMPPPILGKALGKERLGSLAAPGALSSPPHTACTPGSQLLPRLPHKLVFTFPATLTERESGGLCRQKKVMMEFYCTKSMRGNPYSDVSVLGNPVLP